MTFEARPIVLVFSSLLENFQGKVEFKSAGRLEKTTETLIDPVQIFERG